MFVFNLKKVHVMQQVDKRILDSLSPPQMVFACGAHLLNAIAAPPACAHPTAAAQVGGMLLPDMLHSSPAAHRVAAAAAIAAVIACVSSVVVAAAFPSTCVPFLRNPVAISPPPGNPEGVTHPDFGDGGRAAVAVGS